MTAQWSTPVSPIDAETALLGRLVQERLSLAWGEAFRSGGEWRAGDAAPSPDSGAAPRLRHLSWQPVAQEFLQGRVQDRLKFSGEALLRGTQTVRFGGELHRDRRNGALYRFVVTL